MYCSGEDVVEYDHTEARPASYRKDCKEERTRFKSTSNLLIGHTEEMPKAWTARHRAALALQSGWLLSLTVLDDSFQHLILDSKS